MKLALALALSFVSSIASAQQLGGQRYLPAGSADGVLGTEGATTRPDLDPYLAVSAHYALNPAVVPNGDEDATIVQHLLGIDLVASLSLAYGFEVGALLPLSVVRSGDAALGVDEPSGPAIHDVALRLAWRWQLGDASALAIHVPLLLPTASDDDVLALGFGARPTLAFSQAFGASQLLLNVSYLLREGVDLADYTGGNELGARVGFRHSFGVTGATSLLAELGLATSPRDFFAGANTPFEGRVGLEQQLSKKLLFRAFVGAGGIGVGGPDVRLGLGLAFTDEGSRGTNPRSGDRDGDHVVDHLDRCLDDAEDRDGFEDGDGCPDFDNDGDGFFDEDDECPQAPETRNGILDDDGCPDFIEVEESSIVTLQPVYFETDSERVAQRSHAMLDEIVATMQANPQVALSVEGHTDGTGEPPYNLALSERRAASVRTYLVEHGLDEQRVESHGFGETQPIDSNNTEEGRSHNRRVEFHLGIIREGE